MAPRAAFALAAFAVWSPLPGAVGLEHAASVSAALMRERILRIEPPVEDGERSSSTWRTRQPAANRAMVRRTVGVARFRGGRRVTGIRATEARGSHRPSP